jgi:hypothetical protein
MSNIKKIIIVVVVIVLAFIAYSYFFVGSQSASSSGVSKQTVTTSTATPAGAALDGPGKEFVTQLLAIQNIKFNLDIFTDPVFQGLKDWHKDLVPQESGRPNPFAPLDGVPGSTLGSDPFATSSTSDAGGVQTNSGVISGGSNSSFQVVPTQTTSQSSAKTRTKGKIIKN